MNGLKKLHWKQIFAIFVVFTLQSAGVSAQTVDNPPLGKPVTMTPLDRSNPEFQITERGAHHRKWERVDKIIRPDGEEEEVVRSYTELASGLNYWDEDAADWIESRAIVEPFEGGAVARQGQTKVIFSPTLGDPNGTVDILSDDGQRFRSVVLGLSYYDPISGDDVILSEVNPDVVGQIIPPNQVIYPNAFKDIQADLVYEYRRFGFSQNVVLHEQPPDPALIGFSDSTRLEVLSEFLESPDPVKRPRIIRPIVDTPAARQAAAQADLVDETLEFGSVRIGEGRAFDLSKGPGAPEQPGTIVVKKWSTIEGRQILFEGVEYSTAEESLKDLPPATRLMNGNEALLDRDHRGQRSIPARQFAQRRSRDPHNVKLAQSDIALDTGYLIDYEILTGTLNNYRFKTGETYLMTTGVIFTGTTIFEGGAVIKYGGDRSWALVGDVDFQTSEYHPLIITSINDDTVGETILESTGIPPSYPFHYTNGLTLSGDNREIKNVRIRYCRYPIWINHAGGGGGHRIRNVQILDSYLAITSFGATNIKVENALIVNAYQGFYTQPYPGGSIDGTVIGTNVTMDDVEYAVSGAGDPEELKNSILIADTFGTYIGKGESHNVELSSSTGVFQSTGGGHFYLAANSPYRDLGTSSIDPDLADELKNRTTYPPIELPYQHRINADTVWTPRIARDTDQPDLGYHYAALDYVMDDCTIAEGKSLLVKPGTALAIYGTNAGWAYGLRPEKDSLITLKGDPLRPVVLTTFDTVQEGSDFPNPLFGAYHVIPIDGGPSTGYDGLIFDHVWLTAISTPFPGFFSVGADSGYTTPANFDVVNSRFLNVRCYAFAGGSLRFSNSIFKGWVNGDVTLLYVGVDQIVHNLFDIPTVYFGWYPGTVNHYVRENIFEGVVPLSVQSTLETSPYFHYGYNAFHDSDPIFSIQSTDIDHTSAIAYEEGPLGYHYLPSSHSHIDAGSQTADLVGLYHYTTQTDQTLEATSVVDIGLHYPALDPGGALLDTDHDRIPNIFEDSNGNGVVDTGESDWQSSENGTTGVPGLQVFNLLD